MLVVAASMLTLWQHRAHRAGHVSPPVRIAKAVAWPLESAISSLVGSPSEITPPSTPSHHSLSTLKMRFAVLTIAAIVGLAQATPLYRRAPSLDQARTAQISTTYADLAGNFTKACNAQKGKQDQAPSSGVDVIFNNVSQVANNPTRALVRRCARGDDF